MTVQSVEKSEHANAVRRNSFLDKVFNWIPIVLLAYPILIVPIFVDRSAGEDVAANITASKSNALNQLFWIGLFGVTLVSAGSRLLKTFSVLRSPLVWILLAYLLLAVASVLWSHAPGIAFRRVVLQIIIVMSLVISVSFTDDAGKLLRRLLLFMNIVVLLNAVAVVVLPPTPIGHAGIYTQKNGLGAVMALAFMFNLYGLLVSRGLLKRVAMLLISGLAFGLLILSQSKTSLGLAFLIPIIAYLAVGMAFLFRINAALLILFGAMTGAVLWALVSSITRFDFADLSLLLFNDVTYTGRTVIWAFVLDVISRSPFLGQGYASFWGTGADSIAFREAPGFVILLLQAHNGYLDILLELGAIGFTLLLLAILTALISAARVVKLDYRVAFLCYSLMLFVMCHNMLESSWFRSYSLNWLIFLLAALLPNAVARTWNR